MFSSDNSLNNKLISTNHDFLIGQEIVDKTLSRSMANKFTFLKESDLRSFSNKILCDSYTISVFKPTGSEINLVDYDSLTLDFNTYLSSQKQSKMDNLLIPNMILKWGI